MKQILAILATCLALGTTLPMDAAVTGQWDFNASSLAATIGTDLAYMGDTDQVTTFSTVTIKGQSAVVMGFPAATGTQGYTMTHGIAPNGGGLYVNQYTLIMDIMFPAASMGKYRGLFQTNPGNGNDSDLFVNTGNGVGISGNYSGTLQADTWHRVAFVFDLALTSGQLRKYIDGVKVGTQNLGTAVVDGRFSLDTTALLFTDNDGETAAGFVNSIQVHDVALTDNDVFALGSVTAAGIPTNIPPLTAVAVTVSPTNQSSVVGMNATCFTANAYGSGTLSFQWYRNGVALAGQTTSVLRFTPIQLTNAGNYTVVVKNAVQSATNTPAAVLTVEQPQPALVTGQWDFTEGDLRATVGQPLQYFDAQVQTDSAFNTNGWYGISDMGGKVVTLMNCNPSSGGAWGGFIVPHGIAPNGGGAKVNQYTVIMDVLYPSWSAGYRGLWQTTAANTNDSDVFLNSGNGVGISQQYDGTLSLDVWHRVVLAFDLTKRELCKYIDGTNVLTAPVGVAPYGPHGAQYLAVNTDPTVGGGVDQRWSLDPTALLFADEDGEVAAFFVSSIQVRSGRMTDVAVAALGGPTADKIPGAIMATRSGNTVTIVWTGSVLESAPTLNGPWSEVTGAAHPYTATVTAGNKFFRVKQ